MALPCLDSQENIIDWQALSLSLKLAAVTLALLLPPGMLLARWLAYTEFKGKYLIEALVVLPLVLPPTVLGYYLLVSFGAASPLGQWLSQQGISLAFHFSGLVVASVLFNIPFLVQPIQRAFEAIPANLGEAAAVSGLNAWRIFWRIELPLAWPGVLSAMVLTSSLGFASLGVGLYASNWWVTVNKEFASFDRNEQANLGTAELNSAMKWLRDSSDHNDVFASNNDGFLLSALSQRRGFMQSKYLLRRHTVFTADWESELDDRGDLLSRVFSSPNSVELKELYSRGVRWLIVDKSKIASADFTFLSEPNFENDGYLILDLDLLS